MKCVISVLGKDRSGVVAAIATTLADCGANIDDISQTILGEGRTATDRIEACGVGGGVGTSAQSRDAAAKASPGNFEQFVTGRNVVKNKAVVDLASCYYWDGNN